MYLEDSPIEGFSESDEMHGPVRSLRENHEVPMSHDHHNDPLQVLFNFKDHSTYIDLDYMYRIRLDRVGFKCLKHLSVFMFVWFSFPQIHYCHY